MRGSRSTAWLIAALISTGPAMLAGAEQRRQPVPRPFPQPDTRSAPQRPTPPETPAASDTRGGEAEPTEETLGLPLYPTAQFITSYDAGRGQRYYLFGTNSSFEEMVAYYAVVLDERGDRVFDAPATHIFEVGRFREEAMAFPPGVTVKDYTWNGSDGYLNPGRDPERFRTIIQVVPEPPGAAR